MRRNRKNSIRKERIVMIASSAFVLAALTMTGVYMKEKSMESKDDGYSIDFTELEQSADDKYQEIAQNDLEETQKVEQAEIGNMEDDLDYMPLEAGSGLVEIPGLTEGLYTADSVVEEEFLPEEELKEDEEQEEVAEEKEASAQNVVVAEELYFSEEEGLMQPVTGDILMHYSMDGSIYFATLDQYKYNPAVMFAAEEGSSVSACAEGKVVNIYEDSQLGHTITLDLGSGYLATYGQLKDIQVTMGSYVEAGDTIASVAAPTKYYSVEGCHLYFELTKDGTSVNPEGLF